MRVIAVDWSGDFRDAHRSMWLAEVRDGELSRLENGRSRAELVSHLISLTTDDPELIVGLDFAFSAPSWFLLQQELGAPQLWALAASRSERWLKDCLPPFWGRPGTKRPDLIEHFRMTDKMSINGISPKSVFQIGGAGAVGTGSLRGWPFLHELKNAGFTVWPFESGPPPVVLEIYPRLLTGQVVKSSPTAREEYLRSRYPQLAPAKFALASSTEDAFDAAVSALVMANHVKALTNLPVVTDPVLRLEGVIWSPGPVYEAVPTTLLEWEPVPVPGKLARKPSLLDRLRAGWRAATAEGSSLD